MTRWVRWNVRPRRTTAFVSLEGGWGPSIILQSRRSASLCFISQIYLWKFLEERGQAPWLRKARWCYGGLALFYFGRASTPLVAPHGDFLVCEQTICFAHSESRSKMWLVYDCHPTFGHYLVEFTSRCDTIVDAAGQWIQERFGFGFEKAEIRIEPSPPNHGLSNNCHWQIRFWQLPFRLHFTIKFWASVSLTHRESPCRMFLAMMLFNSTLAPRPWTRHYLPTAHSPMLTFVNLTSHWKVDGKHCLMAFVFETQLHFVEIMTNAKRIPQQSTSKMNHEISQGFPFWN